MNSRIIGLTQVDFCAIRPSYLAEPSSKVSWEGSNVICGGIAGDIYIDRTGGYRHIQWQCCVVDVDVGKGLVGWRNHDVRWIEVTDNCRRPERRKIQAANW